jgi:hypothetical protein
MSDVPIHELQAPGDVSGAAGIRCTVCQPQPPPLILPQCPLRPCPERSTTTSPFHVHAAARASELNAMVVTRTSLSLHEKMSTIDVPFDRHPGVDGVSQTAAASAPSTIGVKYSSPLRAAVATVAPDGDAVIVQAKTPERTGTRC